MNGIYRFRFHIALGVTMLITANVWGQESVIRRNLAERVPALPTIDEVRKSPMRGIYEVRMGTELLYTDAHADYVFQGQISATKSGVNLTQARRDQLTAIDFSSLPLEDAIAYKHGTGARKMAVFSDPNCGYCKNFERALDQIHDVTVYTFLNPVLGEDSPRKARNIWCSKDRIKVWRNWMVGNIAPTEQQGACDASAVDRNMAIARRLHFVATPTLIFEDGKQVRGVVPPEDVESQLASSSASKRP